METECAVAKDFRDLKTKLKADKLQYEIAKLVAEKYLHLYVPGKFDSENKSHVHWLKTWADLLSGDQILQRKVLLQLDKFNVKNVDWDE